MTGAKKKKATKAAAKKPTRRISYAPDSPKAVLFCERFIIHLNQTKAAEEAGYSKKRARQAGCDLMQLPEIQARIQELLDARAVRNEIEADAVIQRLHTIATADPRELIEHRVGACRYCHGVSHQYQRTPAERSKDFATWSRIKPDQRVEHELSTITGEFDERGGVGYLITRDPHPGCPECSGLGEGFNIVHDQRKLSAAAAQLLAGVKETREGIEVKMHSQPDALVNVGRHLKLFTDKVEHGVTESLEDILAKSWAPPAAAANA